MNFTHLKAFYSVARLKSFTRAAQELNVSQPTISLQVQGLEDQYDMVLINRSKKAIELTDEGNLVFSVAEKIFSLSSDLECKLRDINPLWPGKLQIGTTPLLGRYLIPEIIQEIKHQHPKLGLELYAGLSRGVLSKVVGYEYHIGIIDRLPYPGNIVAKRVLKPPIYFITSDHMKDQIHLKELSDYPIILLNEGSAIREYVIREFKKRNVPLNIHIECENPPAIKDMVSRGMGGTFLPWYCIEMDVREGRYRCVEIIEGFAGSVDMIYLVERKKSKAVKIFKSIIDAYPFSKFAIEKDMSE